MELQFENLVGKREAKENFEEVIMLEVTPGNFRVSPLAAAKLDITDSSNVAFVKAGDTYYIGKGKEGIPVLEADGTQKVDKRGRKVFEEDASGYGALAREIKPGSNVLRFSVASAWKGLGGDGDNKKIFSLGEGTEQTLRTDSGSHTTMLYPLVWERDEAKEAKGKASASDDAPADDTPEVQNAAVSDFSEDL